MTSYCNITYWVDFGGEWSASFSGYAKVYFENITLRLKRQSELLNLMHVVLCKHALFCLELFVENKQMVARFLPVPQVWVK